MMAYSDWAMAQRLRSELHSLADPEFAGRYQRYFREDINALGVPNGLVTALAHKFDRQCMEVTAERRLVLAETILENHEHHEEVLLAFALLRRAARRGVNDEFLSVAHSWVESYVSNWAQCDDMCLKLLFTFLMGHTHIIPATKDWVWSRSPWARRAANVAVVKFVRRKAGSHTLQLPLDHVWSNCLALMKDDHYYVQKGCGWLLKVAGAVHQAAVAEFVACHVDDLRRDTFRYAIESQPAAARRHLISLKGGR